VCLSIRLGCPFGALNLILCVIFDGNAVYEFENVEGEAGCVVRLKPDYVRAAHWYYGPEKNVPMVIPLEALAIWLHRSEDLPKNSTMDGLVAATIKKLNLQPEELHFIFRSAASSASHRVRFGELTPVVPSIRGVLHDDGGCR
jgi:hypothetical protein